MAELIYPTSLSWDGPWLIEPAKLELLDEIMEEFWPKLQAQDEEIINQEIEDQVAQSTARGEDADREEISRAVRRRRRRQTKGVTLYFETGKSLQVSSFKEALLHPQLNSELADSFYAVVASSKVEAKVRLGANYGGDTLNIECTPSLDPLAVELYGALRNWASSIRPSRWLTRWRSFVPLHWFAFLIVVWIAVGVGMHTTKPDLDAVKADARKLIAEGINNSNQPRAMETLLKLSVSGESETVTFPRWLYAFTLGAIALSVILSFKPPGAILGIGAGEKRLQRWRTWLKIVLVTAPVFLFTNVFWPIISTKLWQR